MVAPSSSAASSSSSSPCSCSPVTSGAHRRRLTDAPAAVDYFVPCDDDDGRGAARVKALFFARRASGGKRVPVVDQAWVRNAVACLLGVAVVIGLVMSSRRGAVGAGGRLVRRVDAEVLGWREENLTAVARRPPDPPVRSSLLSPLTVLRYILRTAMTCTTRV
jgi:hypothetical protein